MTASVSNGSCRYLLRPPFAHAAVQALSDGRVPAAILPPSVVPASGQQHPLGLGDDDDDDSPASESSARPRRIGWARLLGRVFAIGVTVCRKCGGRMRVLDVVTDPDDIARLLHGARAPPRPRPHPPGQVLLFPV